MSRLAATIVAALTAILASPAGAAEVVILESTVPSLAVGSFVDEARPVTIPAGGMISVIMSDGETRVVEGPYEGALASAVGEGSGAGAALTGARGGDTKVLGAVRAPKWDIGD